MLHTLKVGGAEVLAARLAQQLSDEFDFRFVCLDALGTLGEQLQQSGFPVQVVGRREGMDLGCLVRFVRILRSHRVDLLHAHQYTPFFYTLAARMIHRRPPVVLTEHGRHFPDYPRPKRKAFNRFFIEPRDQLVAVGQAVRQALIANEGMPARKVQVIYNGVDLTPCPDPAGTRECVRKELGLSADDSIVGMVARLDYLKDHATALRAIDRVRQKLPRVRLLLVGDGPEETKIRTLARELGLESQLQFLGMRQDVPRLLQAFDVFLLTSISEGIPLTLIEAMGADLPVVSTSVGGVPEVVEHERTGLLAQAQDSQALADHLVRILTDTPLRDRYGKQGRARALTHFSEPLMHDRYRALYRAMLRR